MKAGSRERTRAERCDGSAEERRAWTNSDEETREVCYTQCFFRVRSSFAR